ncbi:phosphatidylinositol mannoside acyltransferase [Aquipuribacter sp. SD81]|uniref:phosphatidylinositol mannoside acyltransferase n=1 Tax=Aquipuribacter sp. SD81 TaxID=3127703 RepID=UPI0030187B92
MSRTGPGRGRSPGARLSERVGAWGYLLAWRVVRLLPEATAYRLADAVADLVARRDGRGVRRLRANLARALPGGQVPEPLVREAVRSYLRYWCDAFRLQDWDRERVVGTVTTEGPDLLPEAVASGRGAVVALAHLGNWDHAGAWAHHVLAPVTTVAERLRPASVYDRFVRYRQALGIRVLAHDDPEVTATLLAELRRGGLVCLLADRDLSRRGVAVDLLGEPAHLAAGPAVLAGRTGALLLPVGLTYRPDHRSPSGYGLRIRFHDAVEVPDDAPETVRRATAQVAHALGESIRGTPADWHMLQRVFAADVEPRPDASDAAAGP